MENTTASRIPRLRLEHFRRDQLKDNGASVDLDTSGEMQHFSVHSRFDHPCKDQVEHSRRDYYKITLVIEGSGVLTYDGRSFDIEGPSLGFINPASVADLQATRTEQNGYYCVFRERFLASPPDLLPSVRRFPLFQVGAMPFLQLSREQTPAIADTFRHMLQEYRAHRPWRQDALRLHLQMLLLQARRVLADERQDNAVLDAAHRHAQAFLDLLEREFPIESVQEAVGRRTPAAFADALALHPNHLNAQVKQTTGKSVQAHIQERLLLEGRLLLTYTDWRIAEIARCLGFSEPASFSHFFNRHTGRSPSSVRP